MKKFELLVAPAAAPQVLKKLSEDFGNMPIGLTYWESLVESLASETELVESVYSLVRMRRKLFSHWLRMNYRRPEIAVYPEVADTVPQLMFRLNKYLYSVLRLSVVSDLSDFPVSHVKKPGSLWMALIASSNEAEVEEKLNGALKATIEKISGSSGTDLAALSVSVPPASEAISHLLGSGGTRAPISSLVRG